MIFQPTPEETLKLCKEALLIADLGRGKAISEVRIGANAVYKSDDFFIKLHFNQTEEIRIQQQIDFAEHLNKEGFPSSRSLTKNPVSVSGYWVTFWQAIENSGRRAQLPKLGLFLSDLHKITKSHQADLPLWDKFDSCSQSLQDPDIQNNLGEEGVLILSAEKNRISNSWQQSIKENQDLAIHGDINISNIIVDPAGYYYLIDFDHIARGSAQIELSSRVAAEIVDPVGSAGSDSFVKAYDLNPEYRPGLIPLAEIKLLDDTLQLAEMKQNERVSRELSSRLDYYRRERQLIKPWQAVW